MTTLERMIELSGNIVSLSAQCERRRQDAGAPKPTPDVETVPIERFRRLKLHVPAGAHDHEYHTPAHTWSLISRWI